MKVLYFSKDDGSGFLEATVGENQEKSYIADLAKQGYKSVSEKVFKQKKDKAEKELMSEHSKIVEDKRKASEVERLEAIKDAKKLGWTDFMIDYAFPKPDWMV